MSKSTWRSKAKATCFSWALPPYLLRQGLSLNWELIASAGLLASKLQGSSWLSLTYLTLPLPHSTGVKGIYYSTQCFMWARGIQIHHLNYLPIPAVSFKESLHHIYGVCACLHIISCVHVCTSMHKTACAHRWLHTWEVRAEFRKVSSPSAESGG